MIALLVAVLVLGGPVQSASADINLRVELLDFSFAVGETPILVSFTNSTGQPQELDICNFEVAVTGALGQRSVIATRSVDDACGGVGLRLSVAANGSATTALFVPQTAKAVEVTVSFLVRGRRSRDFRSQRLDLPSVAAREIGP